MTTEGTKRGGLWDSLCFTASQGTGVSACEKAGYIFGSKEQGVRGKAGTPGFWAPEMLQTDKDGKSRRYGPAADWWSFGCLIYALITSKGPFSLLGGTTNDDNTATLEKEPEYDPRYFSPTLTSLVKGLLLKDPAKRLGGGALGCKEIMEHPFFKGIDWVALEKKESIPPFTPTMNILDSTRPVRPWNERDKAKAAGQTLVAADHEKYAGLPFVSESATLKEYIQNLALYTETAARGESKNSKGIDEGVRVTIRPFGTPPSSVLQPSSAAHQGSSLVAAYPTSKDQAFANLNTSLNPSPAAGSRGTLFCTAGETKSCHVVEGARGGRRGSLDVALGGKGGKQCSII